LNLDLPYLPGVQPDVVTPGTILTRKNFRTCSVMSRRSQSKTSLRPKNRRADDPLLDVPGVRIGKRGIEKTYDGAIRGRAGASRVEVNAYGRGDPARLIATTEQRAATSISPSTVNCRA